MSRPRTRVWPSRPVLLKLYRTKTDEAIGALYGCSKDAVKGWRRHYGIQGIRRSGDGLGAPRRYDRPSKEQLISLTALSTDKEIAEKYGCSRENIRKWRMYYGLQKTNVVYRRRPWAYDLDEDFFAKIDTEEKAYILGLLATDGCVSRGRVCLSLQARDEHILQDILRAMRSTSPIHDRPKGSFPGSGPMKYIAFTSRKSVADLAKWGVVPRKSSSLTYANIGRRLERHYVRGLFDGDGSLHPKIFYFLGTKALIDGVIEAIRSHTGIALNRRRAGKLYRASGYKGSRKVLHWMYDKSTIFLHRKRKIFDESWGC